MATAVRFRMHTTERLIELLTLWERHMASIDEQLKALSDKIDNIEKPADISALQTAVAGLQTALSQQQAALNSVATNVAAIATKLPIDQPVSSQPTV